MASIYKVVSQDVWQDAEAKGFFAGAGIDLTDGYIHFSTAEQLVETVVKHFARQENLLIIAIDPGKLGVNLKWEPSRGGALFPHLYAPLPLSAVNEVMALPIDESGSHRFPEGPWNGQTR